MAENPYVSLVSVIIPTYNRADLVCTAIESVLAQTYKHIEIIVVDDGSTDGTKDIVVQKFGDKVKYLYQEKGGAPSARNLGFKASTGNYINFLDSDDYFLPENIRQKIKAFEENPDIEWVFTDSYHRDDKKNIFIRNPNIDRLRERLNKTDNVFDILLFNGVVNTNNAMLKRGCIEEVGGFDEALPAFQDAEFFYRTSKKYKTKFIDMPLAVQNIQEGSLSSDPERYYRGKALVVEKVKIMFPEEAKRLGYPSKKTMADIYNYRGLHYLNQREKVKAAKEFLKSLRATCLQKEVYFLLLKCLL